ncbi:hypothetical protein B0H13DRAFT_2362188 [Mycena leptocephala]|nr:hypothetical protein B0H13DRAFT_2362188 [Mycena leptocephala]
MFKAKLARDRQGLPRYPDEPNEMLCPVLVAGVRKYLSIARLSSSAPRYILSADVSAEPACQQRKAKILFHTDKSIITEPHLVSLSDEERIKVEGTMTNRPCSIFICTNFDRLADADPQDFGKWNSVNITSLTVSEIQNNILGQQIATSAGDFCASPLRTYVSNNNVKDDAALYAYVLPKNILRAFITAEQVKGSKVCFTLSFFALLANSRLANMEQGDDSVDVENSFA